MDRLLYLLKELKILKYPEYMSDKVYTVWVRLPIVNVVYADYSDICCHTEDQTAKAN